MQQQHNYTNKGVCAVCGFSGARIAWRWDARNGRKLRPMFYQRVHAASRK